MTARPTLDDQPHINGMGAYEGWQNGAGVLVRQKLARNATQALSELDDDTFAAIVAQAMRHRPWPVALRVISEVQA